MTRFPLPAFGLALSLLVAPASSAAAADPAGKAADPAPTTSSSPPGNRVHGVVYTIDRIRAVKSLGGENDLPVTRADGVFVILRVRMENVSKAPISFLTSSLALVDDSRNLYSVSIDALSSLIMSNDKNAELVQTLQPGLIKTVTAVFDVPQLTHATFYLSADDAGAKRGGAAFDVPIP